MTLMTSVISQFAEVLSVDRAPCSPVEVPGLKGGAGDGAFDAMRVESPQRAPPPLLTTALPPLPRPKPANLSAAGALPPCPRPRSPSTT